MRGLVAPTDFDSMTDEELEIYFQNSGKDEQDLILQFLTQREVE